MKLLIFATLDEAKTTLEKLSAKFLANNLYSYSNGLIAISGMGCFASQMTVAKYIANVTEVINLGFAASLKRDLLGEVFVCGKVGKYVPLPEPLDEISSLFMNQAIPQKYVSEEKISLISSDFPVHSQFQREALNDWDLLDMEGYGVAYAASFFDKKCTLIKIASDFAKVGGHALIQKYKNDLSQTLYQFSEKFLNR